MKSVIIFMLCGYETTLFAQPLTLEEEMVYWQLFWSWLGLFGLGLALNTLTIYQKMNRKSA